MTFLLNDYNYPLVSQTYVVQTSSLTGDKRNQLKALLKAEIMGWRDSLKDPTEGATLAVNTYGKSQKLKPDHRGGAVQGAEPADPRQPHQDRGHLHRAHRA